MLDVVLYQPEIPPNTGNIIRLCANCGARLHLIRPLGFEMDHKQLRRAGLDYHEYADVTVYDNYEELLVKLQPSRVFAVSTRGKTPYDEVAYHEDDVFVFGPETRGLPAPMLNDFKAPHIIRIPMVPHSRSLNLSNAAAVVLYEAWRQHGFTVDPEQYR